MESIIPEKPKRRLSKKAKGFAKDVFLTNDPTQAVLNNYDTTDKGVAASIAYENLKKPQIQQAISDYASRIPDDLLERVHLEGLEATKKIFKNNNESGEIEMVAEEPDFQSRHKFLDSAYKLKGMYAPEKSVSLNIDIPNNNDPELDKIREQFNEAAKQKVIDKIKNNENRNI